MCDSKAANIIVIKTGFLKPSFKAAVSMMRGSYAMVVRYLQLFYEKYVCFGKITLSGSVSYTHLTLPTKRIV